MCAICGFASTGALPSEQLLQRMRDSMLARGPDDAGLVRLSGAGLGSRRLSILDLSPLGRMPMSTEDGRYWIVHNGEIYNFREIRARLEARGHAFLSGSDAEVLLRAFADEGPAMLGRLNGMFAFAIWDEHNRTLFLARDRLGVKPLHWAVQRGVFYFASEPKALFAAGVSREGDPAAWPELLLFRYTSGTATPYRGIQRLLPGHFLTWRAGEIRIQEWWSLGDRIRERRSTRPSAREYLPLLADSVSKRLISDVPVGVLLSGGLDSSAVTVLASQARQRELSAFTCRFEDPVYDEGPAARAVAARYGLSFHERFVKSEELLEGLNEATAFQDEPLAHSSHLHMRAVSSLAKPRATVLLSGEGADETLGGYERYRPLRAAALFPLLRAVSRLIPGSALPPRVQKLVRLLQEGNTDAYLLLNACETFPAQLRGLGLELPESWAFRDRVSSEARSLYPGSPLRQAMYLDQKTFLVSLLDRNDRMTMAASIECRVPFLDYRVVELAGSLPSGSLFWRGRGKAPVRRAMVDCLPPAVWRGRKWGFGVPWTDEFRKVPALRGTVEALADSEAIKSSPLDREAVRALVRSFLAGEDSNALLIQGLVMIAIWSDVCLRQAPDTARATAGG